MKWWSAARPARSRTRTAGPPIHRRPARDRITPFADPPGADLTGADLTGAELARASLGWARWSASTRWPQDRAEEIRARSREAGPGVWRVTGTAEEEPGVVAL
ncbi:pentapeptide repeat-containing protein [Actinomadura kijaniata]|uniref:pentapeptide repeat-containing protein n=1 Tax=Actinomadura kijaniata TaxID=46161 RepID=UPI003F1B1B03